MYRDSFEKCPRCAAELTDARSARGCRACGGLWVAEAVLIEMVTEMLPLGALVDLQLWAHPPTEPTIACPACGDRMDQTEIHQVRIDRCFKHGVWFDPDELQRALQRTGEAGSATAPTSVVAEPDPATPVSLPIVDPTPPPPNVKTAAPPEPAAPPVPTPSAASSDESSWSDDPRMNDRQGLGMGPGDGPWRPGP